MDKNNQEKLKALDVALTQIEKAYGKGAVMKLGDSGANMNIEVVPTGPLVLILHLDLVDCRKVVLLRFTDQNQVVRQQ
mgnify:CR=1 FL=1